MKISPANDALKIGWQSVLRGSGQNILFRAKAWTPGLCISLSNACSNDKISSRVSDCEKTCPLLPPSTAYYAAENLWVNFEAWPRIG